MDELMFAINSKSVTMFLKTILLLLIKGIQKKIVVLADIMDVERPGHVKVLIIYISIIYFGRYFSLLFLPLFLYISNYGESTRK